MRKLSEIIPAVYTRKGVRTMLYRFLSWPTRLVRNLPALIPSSCLLCGMSGDTSVCTDCKARFLSHFPHRCSECAAPLSSANNWPDRCGNCLSTPHAFDATIAAVDYAPPIDQLVLGLKFGAQLVVAPLFAHAIRDTVLRQPELVLPTLLTAVPLGEKRLIERGFNQALEIARPLSRAIAIPLKAQLLVRTSETLMQAMLSPPERHRNIRHAFDVHSNAADLVRGQHVGVVDDVLTTGETLNEIARTLKHRGATRVTNFVFARTPPK